MPLIFLLALSLLTACSDSGGSSQIKVYKVAKQKPAALPPELAASAPKASVSWETPKGWKKLPPAQMRVASFAAGGAEVSVVSLPGTAGGVLANINRWRGQLGIEPLQEKDLPAQTRRVTTKAGPVLLADFTGGGRRMAAGLLFVKDESWFFKMTGSEETVAKAKPSFEKFLGSLRVENR